MKVLVVGAGGRVGSLLLQQGAEGGHTMYAFGRDPTKFTVPTSERCIYVKGDSTVADDVDAAVASAKPDAVCITIGHKGVANKSIREIKASLNATPFLYSTTVKNAVAACNKHGCKRLICLGGEQMDVEGDERQWWSGIIRFLATYVLRAGAAFEDSEALLSSLQTDPACADLDWTVMRASAFMEGPSAVEGLEVGRGMYSGTIAGMGSTVQMVDLAKWMVACLPVNGPWRQKCPAVSNKV